MTTHTLTPVETEVLRLMACGLSYRQIAAITAYSHSSILRYSTRRIFVKLGVTSRTQAALWAWRNGVITVDDAWDVLLEARG